MREKIKRLHKAKYTAPQIAAALKISLTVVRKIIANTTPHNIVMQDTDGELVTVENNPDKLINASTTQIYWGGIYTEPKFEPTAEGAAIIAEIKKDFVKRYSATSKTLVIIGSIIAAQAYPGKVAAMLPVPGYERVAPNEKRMRCDQFTMYRRK